MKVAEDLTKSSVVIMSAYMCAPVSRYRQGENAWLKLTLI